MMTARGLAELARRLEGQRVLSVYVDGRDNDPARRARWRRLLEADIAAIRARLMQGPRPELLEFELSVATLDRILAAASDITRVPSWVAFITGDAAMYWGSEPLDVTTRADWRVGGRLAPLVRGLKEDHPVIVAIVEARKATVFEYRNLNLQRLDALESHPHGTEAMHLPSRSPGRFHPGTRGRTGAEAAAEAMREGRERMYRNLAKKVIQRAGNDAWIIYGGAPEAAQTAFADLPETLQGRARLVPELGISADAETIAAAAARNASALRRERDARMVHQALEQAGARGRGVAGLAATLDALGRGAVHELLLTPDLVEQHPEDAEAMLARALAANTTLEVVAGAGAERLNAEGEGVAGILRFPVIGAAMGAGTAVD